MSGKVCVVTGATSGIGFVTALDLATRGARILLVGRDPNRTDSAVESIIKASNNQRVEGILADLSRPADVTRLAAEIQNRTERLDVLLNNAGIIARRLEKTQDGLERTFAVNHLAYFILTTNLLDLLKRSVPSRVVLVSSEAHRAVRSIDFENLQAEKHFSSFGAYCLSKLGNLLFMHELAKMLEGTGVTVNALHPGFVRTNIFSFGGPFAAISNLSARLVGLSPEEGAKTSIFLATSSQIEGMTGGYYIKQRLAKTSKLARDPHLAQKFWQTTESIRDKTLS